MSYFFHAILNIILAYRTLWIFRFVLRSTHYILCETHIPGGYGLIGV